MSREEMLARRAEARRQAGPSDTEVILVTGPPCSGKSTYVQQYMVIGDLVIDYDALAVALGSPDSHDHPESLRPALKKIWLEAKRVAESFNGRAWIIQGFPHPEDEARSTQVVRLDTPLDTCRARAKESRPHHWQALIDQWEAQYGTQ